MDSVLMQKTFTLIFETGYWHGKVSKSGCGSDPEQTVQLVDVVRECILRWKIGSVVDLGCGDLCWMRNLIWLLDWYRGVDIVHDAIMANTQRYGDYNIEFVVADVTRYSPPSVDAILCRDVLCHLEYEDALRLIANVKQSKSTWFITTTFTNPNRENPVTPSGPLGWYPIVLTKCPFNFPEPEEILVEGCPEVGFEDKSLGVWKIADLP